MIDDWSPLPLLEFAPNCGVYGTVYQYTPSSDVGDVQPAMNSWPSQEFLAGDTAPAPSPFSSHLWSVRRQKWTYDLWMHRFRSRVEFQKEWFAILATHFFKFCMTMGCPLGSIGSICKAARIVEGSNLQFVMAKPRWPCGKSGKCLCLKMSETTVDGENIQTLQHSLCWSLTPKSQYFNADVSKGDFGGLKNFVHWS